MYGFKKVMNLYQTQDNIRFKMDDIETMFKVLKILPTQNNGDSYEVIFLLGNLMVTEGNIDKETGKGSVFGFNSLTKLWTETQVSVATAGFVNLFSYGNIIINNDGVAIGAAKRPLKRDV